ncbi:hypothetical protein M378DRAFT_859016 [Amanita muscaria Koide BX008]|uniref:Uncharacterized protein n=1 Tax=Amanita muscaria (strain Koide BX008) TaxID=946122 RepID=A0A0C2RVI1_AMAMK|nr:hypothetical protein M378DRAFT_859016 [Amanita muscaria Koide BX008]
MLDLTVQEIIIRTFGKRARFTVHFEATQVQLQTWYSLHQGQCKNTSCGLRQGLSSVESVQRLTSRRVQLKHSGFLRMRQHQILARHMVHFKMRQRDAQAGRSVRVGG